MRQSEQVVLCGGLACIFCHQLLVLCQTRHALDEQGDRPGAVIKIDTTISSTLRHNKVLDKSNPTPLSIIAIISIAKLECREFDMLFL